jgi:hypothetical protein
MRLVPIKEKQEIQMKTKKRKKRKSRRGLNYDKKGGERIELVKSSERTSRQVTK